MALLIKPFIHHEWMAATAFEIVHQDQVLGKLTFFDRMIFKGHLTMLQPPLAMKAFLDRQGVLLRPTRDSHDSRKHSLSAIFPAQPMRARRDSNP